MFVSYKIKYCFVPKAESLFIYIIASYTTLYLSFLLDIVQYFHLILLGAFFLFFLQGAWCSHWHQLLLQAGAPVGNSHLATYLRERLPVRAGVFCVHGVFRVRSRSPRWTGERAEPNSKTHVGLFITEFLPAFGS